MVLYRGCKQVCLLILTLIRYLDFKFLKFSFEACMVLEVQIEIYIPKVKKSASDVKVFSLDGRSHIPIFFLKSFTLGLLTFLFQLL